MEMIHHGAAIHIPLALAVLYPPAHILFLILIRREFFPYRSWYLLLGLSAVQIASCVLSYITGRHLMAFSMAQEDLLIRHRDLAWRFSWIWCAILVLIVVAFVPRGKVFAKAAHIFLLIALVVQFTVAFQLGQIGGELIHNN